MLDRRGTPERQGNTHGKAGPISPEASERQHGELDATAAAGMDIGDWWIKEALDRKRLAWTRENFIWEKRRPRRPAGLDGTASAELPAAVKRMTNIPRRNFFRF